ncbi:hypothetical protein [Embleya sp. NPDC001921]
MSATRAEHRASIAEVRNSFAESVGRARYAGATTVLISRREEAAVIVPVDFYRRALEALGETAVPVERNDA